MPHNLLGLALAEASSLVLDDNLPGQNAPQVRQGGRPVLTRPGQGMGSGIGNLLFGAEDEPEGATGGPWRRRR